MKDQQSENKEEMKAESPAEPIAENPVGEPANEEKAPEKEENNNEELAKLNDKYLRLYSDFDNYKKRAIRERSEYLKMAGSEVILSMLPVLDDFERAMKSMNETTDAAAIKEGIALIYNKLKSALQQRGLQEMSAAGVVFDADIHEALAMLPAPTDDQKGKVLEEMEKGYLLNGKVLRHSKVIVGS